MLLAKSHAVDDEMAIMKEIVHVESKKRELQGIISKSVIDMFRKLRQERELKAGMEAKKRKAIAVTKNTDGKQVLIQNQLRGLKRNNSMKKFSQLKTRGLKTQQTKTNIKDEEDADSTGARKLNDVPTLTVSRMDTMKENEAGEMERYEFKRQDSNIKKRLGGLSIFSPKRMSKRGKGLDMSKIQDKKPPINKRIMSSVRESDSYSSSSSSMTSFESTSSENEEMKVPEPEK